MSTHRRTLALAAAALALLATGATRPLSAQGVTTGAISGTVIDTTGRGVESAQIQIVNTATGATTGALTREGGRYFAQGLEVGGPYSVTVRLLGFAPQTRGNLRVSLGQNLRVDFRLVPQALQLTGVTVEAEPNPVFSAARKGVSTLITDSALRRLPTLNRNFTDIVASVPQVSTAGPGLSGGGVNNRFNNIQIDGTNESDIFGLGSTGQPGGQAGGKSIGLESVKQYQVLLSPFDVRQGNFTGLLINAVTKGGTNTFSGTAFYYFRNEDLARDVPLIRNSQYQQKQYGFSLGGPIVRDKIQFFVNPEWQQRTAPAGGPYLGQPTTAQDPFLASQADIERFQQILNSYGIAPGTAGLVNNTNPLTNVFARLDFQLPWNSRLVLRNNYGEAQDDNFSRSRTSLRLSSNGYFFKSTKNATVAQLYTNFANGANNELFVGYNRIRDRRTPNVFAPQISVSVPEVGDTTGGTVTLQSGADQFSQGNELDQNIFEVTDNFTIPLGSHQITIGTSNQFYSIRNQFAQSSYGVYSFRSLDDFAAGTPNSYRVGVNVGGGVPGEVKFGAASYGVYAQDTWQPMERLSLSYGLRADIPVLNDRPALSQFVLDNFGRRTDLVPSGNVQWSPRVGFNLDLGQGDVPSQLRGGVGVFVGRPPFVWVSNAFGNNGLGIAQITCGGSRDVGDAPAFNPDPNNQTPYCLDRTTGEPVGQGSFSEVDLLDKDLKFPQTLRASLGYDRALPGGLVATIEGLYTRGLNNWFYQNINLVGPAGVDRNGRVLYGDSIRTSGQAVPNVRVASLAGDGAIDVTNQSKDYSYSITGQLQKRFLGNNLDMRVAYTYARAYSVQDLTSSRAISNWRFGRTVSGQLSDRNTTVSGFDQPHRITAVGTYTFPWQTFRTSLSAIYTGQSGSPFTYVYYRGRAFGSGDLNADGVAGTDPIYVPRDATDPSEILFSGATPDEQLAQATAFNQFIDSQECLRSARGSILENNSCRNPWQNILNVSLRQSLPTFRGQNVSLQLDVFNFLNLLNNDWGQFSYAGSFPQVNLLQHNGQTPGPATTSQGIFSFNPDYRAFTSTNVSSNYQIQLSARYSF